MKRVLMNLLDNAVGAVGESGEITLATGFDRSRGIVYLEVSDSGSGVGARASGADFRTLFFYKKNGTGLGLTIVSQIIEDHRGYIRVRPNEPRGTRFTIELPARGLHAEWPEYSGAHLKIRVCSSCFNVRSSKPVKPPSIFPATARQERGGS